MNRVAGRRAVSRRVEADRNARRSRSSDGEVRVAECLVRERIERDGLIGFRNIEALLDTGRGVVIRVAILRSRDRARTGAGYMNYVRLSRAGSVRGEGDAQAG